jgi:sugar lactone lactonase YvrE
MRKIAVIVVSLMCLVALAVPAAAGGDAQFPSEIDLPDGFFPEGIAVGRGSTFYVGSLADGSIYKGDLRTGEGSVFTNPTEQGFPQTTVGLDVDQRDRVWASGAASGTGRVYDATSGEQLATYEFTDPFESFINDVIVTAEAAWFTDSGTEVCDMGGLCFIGEPRLFKVALDRDGNLPDPADLGAVEEIPVDVPDIYFSNLNGIETMPGNSGLIVVHNELGALYRVDPASGDATVLYGPPNDPPLQGPDGMSRLGRTLYVVENAASQISEIRLDPSAGTGTLQAVLPVVGAQTSTTSALFGSAVYTVDARLGTPFVGPYRIFRIER